MPTSDSEDFESADETGGSFDKKLRKKRNSSSCYSDNALDTVTEAEKAPAGTVVKENFKVQENVAAGWEDFDIGESDSVTTSGAKPVAEASHIQNDQTSRLDIPKEAGWDDFDDWGDDDVVNNIIKNQPKLKDDKDVNEITDRLAATATTPSSSGWGWGWGVDSLLNTATAGITSITNQVSQGISSALETGIGAPDPVELAKKNLTQQGDSSPNMEEELKEDFVDDSTNDKVPLVGNGDGAMGSLAPLGSLFKFVGSAGSKVIHGGLDTLEIIGKKAMDLLQEHDPNLMKKRELLGLEPSVPVLSQVLREAKERAEEEDRIREEKQEAKEVHYEHLFDDFGEISVGAGEAAGEHSLQQPHLSCAETARSIHTLLTPINSAEIVPTPCQILKIMLDEFRSYKGTLMRLLESTCSLESSLLVLHNGLVHLEALEILSKRCHFKIEETLRDATPDRKSDMKDTLLMVAHLTPGHKADCTMTPKPTAFGRQSKPVRKKGTPDEDELCELPEEDEEESCINMLEEERRLETIERHKQMNPADVFLEKLQKATEDLAIKIQFQPIVKQYSNIIEYFKNEENDFTPKTLQKKAVASLAEATALALEIYHKSAEMLLVLERRMVADESDSLTKMTTLLSAHFTDIANLYVNKLTEGDSFQLNIETRSKVTRIYLVANDSASYVQNALLMMHTVLQVGAI